MYSSCQSEVRHTAEAKDALAISLLSCTLWQTLATPRSCPISFFFLFFCQPGAFVCVSASPGGVTGEGPQRGNAGLQWSTMQYR